ncbi:11713_t:CDS:2, partial [Cetraspora pellucida]
QETESQEAEDDLKIIDPLNLYISMFDKSDKEVVEELVELIEDVDEFSWMYAIFFNTTYYLILYLFIFCPKVITTYM